MKRMLPFFKHFIRLNFSGVAIGLVFYCLALTPSLLPRPPLFAGIIAGISFGVGYSIGVGTSWIIRRFIKNKEPKPPIKRYAWYGLIAASTVGSIAYSIWNTSWENEVRVLIGEPPLEGQHVVLILAMGLVSAAALITVGKLFGRLVLLISNYVDRWLPAYVSFCIGLAATTTIAILTYNGIIVKQFIRSTNAIYSEINKTTPSGISRTNRELRSGSKASLVSWESLGYQGRNFIGRGPSAQQISAQSGQQAAEPIRVYIGLDAAQDAKTRADLAVQELERTGAFKRSVLVVAGSTGTGWIEPRASDALEYMWNGDSAIVSAQYSYLPSWISFLVDQRKASETGAALFDAVYAKWQTLPHDARPKLISYGLSLGSFGAQSAFSSPEEMHAKTSGALYVGTPNFSQPWKYIGQTRDKGSPLWQPQYKQGAIVQFAASNQDLARIATPSWQAPRILYVQHASDPVVWWDYDLIWQKPDWLKEKRGPDVSADMQWYPFVTFAQVSVDQFFGVSVTNGHGHNYGSTVVDAWASVASPPNWTHDKAQKLQHFINSHYQSE